jgi:hypothetical protein
MVRKNIRNNLGVIFAAGSVWGLIEFGAGMGLQKCATLFTGAILTGLAFFWFSFIWSLTRRILPLLILVAIAMLFKWLDALLLQVAWNHGSILNPMFAFFTGMAGFVVAITLFRQRLLHSQRIRILAGGTAALLATFMFPLVKFVSGTPACLSSFASLPVSIVTSPVAIVISMIMVPLGFLAARWFERQEPAITRVAAMEVLIRMWPAAICAVCIGVVVAVRLA